MTESLKFGPEWLRNLSSPFSNNGAMAIPKYHLADFRYGREEMLALFDKNAAAPAELCKIPMLHVEKMQLPLALIQMTDDEIRTWSSCVNSDVGLSKQGKIATSNVLSMNTNSVTGGMSTRGRPITIPGKGRGRSSYYNARSYEDNQESVNTTFGRNRTFDRSQNHNQGDRAWPERNGNHDYSDWNGYGNTLENGLSTSPRKDFGSSLRMQSSRDDTNWRRRPTRDEDENRKNSRHTDKLVRPNPSISWRDGGGERERDKEHVDGVDGSKERRRPSSRSSNSTSTTHSQRRISESREDNLPEWANETLVDINGTFDSSGAFHGSSNYLDEDAVKEIIKNKYKNDTAKRIEYNKRNKSVKFDVKESVLEDENKNSPLRENVSENESFSDNSDSNVTSKNTYNSTSIELAASDKKVVSQMTDPEELISNHVSRNSADSNKTEIEISSECVHSTDDFDKTNNTAYIQSMNNEQPKSPSLIQNDVNPSTHTSVEKKEKHRYDEYNGLVEDMVSKIMEDEEKPQISLERLENMNKWFYCDPQGNVQGPFSSSEMTQWHEQGYFLDKILVRRASETRYYTLSDLVQLNGPSPFRDITLSPTNDRKQQPPKVSATVPSMQTTMTSESTQSILQDPLLFSQAHSQLPNQNFLLRQQQDAPVQNVLNQLNENSRWSSLPISEQQRLIMQTGGNVIDAAHTGRIPTVPIVPGYLPPAIAPQLLAGNPGLILLLSQMQQQQQQHYLQARLQLQQQYQTQQLQQHQLPQQPPLETKIRPETIAQIPPLYHAQLDTSQQQLFQNIAFSNASIPVQTAVSRSQSEPIPPNIATGNAAVPQTTNTSNSIPMPQANNSNTATINETMSALNPMQALLKQLSGSEEKIKADSLWKNDTKTATSTSQSTEISFNAQQWLAQLNSLALSNGGGLWTSDAVLPDVSSMRTEKQIIEEMLKAQKKKESQSDEPASTTTSTSNKVNERKKNASTPLRNKQIHQLNENDETSQEVASEDDAVTEKVSKISLDNKQAKKLQQQQQQQQQQEHKSKQVEKKVKPVKQIENKKPLKLPQEDKKVKQQNEKTVNKQPAEKKVKLVEDKKQKANDEDKKKKEEERKRKDDQHKKELEKKREEAEEKNKEELIRRRKIEEEKRQARELAKKEKLQSKETGEEIRKLEQQKRQQEALRRLHDQQLAAAANSKLLLKSQSAPVIANKTTSENQSADEQESEKKKKRQKSKQKSADSSETNNSVSTVWAETKKLTPKSLTEIQIEEQKQLLKKKECEKAERLKRLQEDEALAAVKAIEMSVRLNPWSIPATVNNNNASSAKPELKPTNVNNKQSSNVRGNTLQNSATANNSASPVHSAKKEKKEKSVSLKQISPTNNDTPPVKDEFYKWGIKALSKFKQSFGLDVPTCITFLREVKSLTEITDYVHELIGENKESREFISQFVERRVQVDGPLIDNLHSQYVKSSFKSKKSESAPTSTVKNNYSNAATNNKKFANKLDANDQERLKRSKKKQMLKIDSNILGFSVTAAADRVNVGDRDYGDVETK